MSAFKDMLIDIQESIERGTMTYQQIADMYGIPVKDVMLIWRMNNVYCKT